jgi:hypothetical protein
VLPANDETAVESTPGSLRADGPAAAGLGNLLAIAEHNALLAPIADCRKAPSQLLALTGRRGRQQERRARQPESMVLTIRIADICEQPL